MTDPFAITSTNQRRVLFGAILLYAGLFVAELATDNRLTAAGADLLLALIVVPASVVVMRRATSDRSTDVLAVLIAVAFLVAGLSVGYEGVVTLELVPAVFAFEMIGSVALLTALLLYLYRSR